MQKITEVHNLHTVRINYVHRFHPIKEKNFTVNVLYLEIQSLKYAWLAPQMQCNVLL